MFEVFLFNLKLLLANKTKTICLGNPLEKKNTVLTTR